MKGREAVDTPPSSQESRNRWQIEADLLADGRELLERSCTSTRYRHLFPEGPSSALLLAAYQEFDRLRTVGRVRGGRWRRWRTFRGILKRTIRDDVLDRSRRLNFRYPLPRSARLPPPPPVVQRALSHVDQDARDLLSAYLGTDSGRMAPYMHDDPSSRATGVAGRGLVQFKEALFNEALATPSSIATLHIQYLAALASAIPTRQRHPVASLLLVKLPLQFLLLVFTIVNVAYIGAYYLFNDETLGDFISVNVSGLLQGDLELGSVHWEGRLIFDLLTGTPSPVVARDVNVWEPYKLTDHGRTRRAVHADRVNATLSLHEIIPWNRLGIPTLFEIPWVLHFEDVEIPEPMWYAIREYDDTTADGAPVRYVGLKDAFKLLKTGPYVRRGLAFQVDQATANDTVVEIDYTQTAQWLASLRLDEADFSLLYEPPDPDFTAPMELPFAFSLRGSGPEGILQIDDIELPIGQFDLRRFASNEHDIPAGDLIYELQADVSGSDIQLHGTLRDMFSRLHTTGPPDPARVALYAVTPNARAITDHLLRELDIPPDTVIARDAEASASIQGFLRAPIYRFAASGLTLDLLGEPAWATDDVRVSLSMATEPVPELWRGRFDDGETRTVVTFEELSGTALDGAFALEPRSFSGAESTPEALDPTSATAHVVMPGAPGEPYLISMPLTVRGVNPGQLTPDDPDLSEQLRGVAVGGVDIRRLMLGPLGLKQRDPEGPDEQTGLLLAELRIDELQMRRDNGPNDDGLPRDITIDGGVTIDEHGTLDLDDLTISIPGARVRSRGGLDPDAEKFRDLLLDLRIDDGRAFARSFALPHYFDQLRARMSVDGAFTSPNGSSGTLTVAGALDTTSPAETKISMDQGTLRVRSDDIRLFGGRGKLDAQIGVFEHGTVSSDPQIRVYIDLKDVDLDGLIGGPVSGRADVELEIGDGDGKTARASELRVTGFASSKALTLAGTTYPDASVRFKLDDEEVAVELLRLPIRRPVSPHFARGVALTVGEIVAEGTVSLDRDPELDLVVEAHGVPLSVVNRQLDIDTPLRGQIGEGTKLTVGGTVARPKVEGRVALVGLAAGGVRLGTGSLEVTSADFEADGPLAAHREIRVLGELQTGRGRNPIQWAVAAVFAIGETSPSQPSAPMAAQLDIDFDQISLRTLLRDPLDPGSSPPVEGQLSAITAHVLTCNPGTAMLSDCIDAAGNTPTERTLAVELAMDGGWVRTGAQGDMPAGADPCESPTTLCAQTPLIAKVDWPMVTLERPFEVKAGGDGGARFTISGNFDLSDPPVGSPETPQAAACRPPPLRRARGPGTVAGARGGAGAARLEGALDLDTVLPLLSAYGLDKASGTVELNVDVEGFLLDPRITGEAGIKNVLAAATTPGASASATAKSGIMINYAPVPFPIRFAELDLRLSDGWLAGVAKVELPGGTFDIGSVDGRHTGYALSGPCAGYFGAAGTGKASATLLSKVVGEPIAPAAAGGVDIRRVLVQGHVAEEVELDVLEGAVKLDVLEGAVRFDSVSALPLEFDDGVTSAKIDRGLVEFRRCGATDCPQAEEGWYALDFGGLAGATATSPPPDVVRASAGARGRIFVWGRAFLDPTFDHAIGTNLSVQMRDVPYRSFDASGRPVFEAEITGEEIEIRGGAPLVVSGNLDVDRARYVKDAVQGVEILALTEKTQQIDAPPPMLLQGMTFDMRLETDRPLRVENNVASGVLADAVVEVSGTYEDPEFTGRLDVEAGGNVDIPFLTGTYEIHHGRVTLLRELEDAEVDILALRNEPIYIDGQPRSVQLQLAGTLSAIRWSCIADGDAGGELDTVRGCTEYLVLGAGDVQVSDNDVQQFGAGGLAGVRKPLSVVGHLTEFDVGERVGDGLPRLRPYVPDVRLRLGQIGPELEIATPTEWFNFDYGRATFGWDYTRGYPGFLLRQSREAKVRLEILDPVTIEYSRRTRSYLNERIVFDPLEQRSVELQFDFEIPSLR